MVFELLQPVADHGRRQAELAAGSGQAALIHDPYEHLHVLQQHCHLGLPPGLLFASV
jgi:hypothetical protein